MIKGTGCFIKHGAVGRYILDGPETGGDYERHTPQADIRTCWEAGSHDRFLPGPTLTPPHTGSQVLENSPVCRLSVSKTVKD